MAYQILPTNTLHVAGDDSHRMNGAASEGFRPGTLLKIVADGSSWKFAAHSDDTSLHPSCFFAMEKSYMNRGLEVPYVAGEECIARVEQPGNQFYTLIAEGVTVAVADLLQPSDDGTLIPLGEGGTARWQALAGTGGATTELTLLLVTQLW